jgi:hypothetical protein
MASVKQIEAIDALIKGEKTFMQLHGSTRKALIEKGLYADGKVTQEGLKVTTVPTVEVDVVTFGADVTYNHPIGEGKYTTLIFPVGTEMVVTFAIEDKKRRMVYLEGLILVNGKHVWVRIAKAHHFQFVKRLMPVKN